MTVRRLLPVAVLGLGLVAAVVLASARLGSPADWDLARLGAATYALAAAMAFLEVGTPLGLVAPTELAVPFAGAAAAAGAVELPVLVLVVWVAAVLGDSTGYLTGRLAGGRVADRVARRGGRVAASHARLVRHFARRGVVTVLVGRWLPYARTGTPLVAGASGMPYARFLAASTLGTGVWACALCSLGYASYASVGRVAELAGQVGLVVLGVVVLVVVTLVVRARRRGAGAVVAEQPVAAVSAGAGVP